MTHENDSEYKDLQDVGYPFEETDGFDEESRISAQDCCVIGQIALSEIVHGPFLSPIAQEMYDKLDDGRGSTQRSHTRRAALALGRRQISEQEFWVLDKKFSKVTHKQVADWSPSDVLQKMRKADVPDARQRQMNDY